MPAYLDVTAENIRESAFPITGARQDYDPLIKMVGDSHFVLLGEATHGTHEFYKARAEITKRLIREKGFNAVAVEADWPDAYRVNRFVRAFICRSWWRRIARFTSPIVHGCSVASRQ